MSKKLFFTEITVSFIQWADDEEDAINESRCLLTDVADEYFDTYIVELNSIDDISSNQYNYFPVNGDGRDVRTVKEILEKK